jgi:hypothetical protein
MKKNCKWGRKYDIIIFHEKNYSKVFKAIILKLFRKVKFIEINLETPSDFKSIKYHDLTIGFGEGYRNMCRFFNSEFYKYLDKYDWYCRLDTDSFITEPINYDFFEFMKSYSFKYGYIAEILDSPDVTIDLGDFMNTYFMTHGLKLTSRDLLFDSNIYNQRIFYTNFEVINLDFFKRNDVQCFLKAIDESGNIFKYRWGDAPLRTFLINAFLSNKEIIRFDDVGYKHYPYTQSKTKISCEFTPEDWILNKKWLGTIKSHFRLDLN